MKKQLRLTYGEALLALGRENPQVVVVDADMADGTRTVELRMEFPDRFYDVGVAEQNLVGVAVGLRLTGLIPFVNTFAWLLTLRAGDMLRTLVSYAATNVKLIGGYGGFSGPMDGATHMSIMDLSVVRSLPGMTVVVVSDHAQLRTALPVIAAVDGPVYLRMSRAEVEDVHPADKLFTLGKGNVLKAGSDLSLICTGTIIARVLEAANQLEARGVQASVVEIHTLKPLDEELILQETSRTGAIVTCEEHNIIGGLGSAVSELVSEKHPVPVQRIGIRDCFGETGPYDDLLDLYGMGVNDIVEAAGRALKLKK